MVSYLVSIQLVSSLNKGPPFFFHFDGNLNTGSYRDHLYRAIKRSRRIRIKQSTWTRSSSPMIMVKIKSNKRASLRDSSQLELLWPHQPLEPAPKHSLSWLHRLTSAHSIRTEMRSVVHSQLRCQMRSSIKGSKSFSGESSSTNPMRSTLDRRWEECWRKAKSMSSFSWRGSWMGRGRSAREPSTIDSSSRMST